jgi:hypothetical protein
MAINQKMSSKHIQFYDSSSMRNASGKVFVREKKLDFYRKKKNKILSVPSVWRALKNDC